MARKQTWRGDKANIVTPKMAPVTEPVPEPTETLTAHGEHLQTETTLLLLGGHAEHSPPVQDPAPSRRRDSRWHRTCRPPQTAGGLERQQWRHVSFRLKLSYDVILDN